MTKKICIMGSAPSSVQLAPYADASYEIWACSPGAVPHLKRVTKFFELHKFEPGKPWFMPDYLQWLAHLAPHNIPVYVSDLDAMITTIPSAVAYPKDAMLEEFGPWFFTSSVAWMLALAIHEGANEIALFGVDMSADDEVYTQQRAGCHHFIHEARKRGIKVTTPPESDLMQPTRLYGFCETSAIHTKLLVRADELKARIQAKTVEIQNANNELFYLQGALGDNEYMIKTWVTDPLALKLAYQNPEPKVDLVYECPDLAEAVKVYDEIRVALPVRKKVAKGSNGKHPPNGGDA
jgi:hypothetical protein